MAVVVATSACGGLLDIQDVTYAEPAGDAAPMQDSVDGATSDAGGSGSAHDDARADASAAPDIGADTGRDSAAPCVSKCCATFDQPDALNAWQRAIEPSTSGAVIAIDPNVAYRGTGSLHVRVPPLGNTNTWAFAACEDPNLPRHVFMRVFVRLASVASFGQAWFHALATVSGSDAAQLYVDTNQISVGTYSAPSMTADPSDSWTNYAPVDGEWFCNELEIDPDQNRVIQGWVGPAGTDPQPTTLSLKACPLLTVLHLGTGSSTGVARELWLDDLVISTQRIGCL